MVDHTRSYYELADYFENISPVVNSKKNLMSREDERKFMLRAKSGDTVAWGELVKANVGLFMDFISKYERMSMAKNVSLSEVAGYVIGRAYQRFMSGFDITKNFRFTTYIFNEDCIRNDVRYALHKSRPGGITSAPEESCTFVQLPFEGSLGQLSEEEHGNQNFQVYKIISEKQRNLPGPSDFASWNLDKDYLLSLLEGLGSRSKKVLVDNYFNKKSLLDIGDELNLSYQAVQQIKKKALIKLRFKIMKDISLEKRLG